MKDGFDNQSNKKNVLTSMLNGGLRNAGLVEVFRMLILQCAEEPVLLVVISEQGTSLSAFHCTFTRNAFSQAQK